jgi:NADPH:quinone reductase-like Zn-dependent oxidoreductase
MVAVCRSTVIEAPIERVWHLLRDFNSHESWHPAIADSEIETPHRIGEVGCVRHFRLQAGGELREQLLTLSDRDHCYTYCILESPIPLIDYVASVRLEPITDRDHTFWEWSSSFGTPAGRETELADLVGEQIYQAGFEGFKKALGSTNPRKMRGADRHQPADARSEIDCKGIMLTGYGGPESLAWQTVQVPPPGPKEVRIRHTAIGVNYIDVYCRTGYFPFVEPPGLLGMEAAGVVIDVGSEVAGLLEGDRIAYACPPAGAYCEFRTMEAELLVLLPEDIDDQTAAAGMLKGMTAEFLLHRVAQVQPDDTVLVHAAAGGVGLLLCQWARALGALVIGTVGSEEKGRLARANGCTYPILYREQDFAEKVMELTQGQGANVVFDAVGHETFMKSFQVLATRGHLVSYGQASGPISPIDIGEFALKSATVSRPNFADYTSSPEEVRSITDRLFAAIRRGTLRVEVRQSFPLREAARAHQALESRETTGSTILLP